MSARPSMYLPRAPQLRRGEVLGAADVAHDLLAAGDEVDGGGELLHGVGGDDDGAGVGMFFTKPVTTSQAADLMKSQAGLTLSSSSACR